MSDTSDTTHIHHSPFDAPKPKRNKGIIIAIIVSIVVHVALGLYLYKTKFEPEYREYSEDVTDVAIIKRFEQRRQAAAHYQVAGQR